LTSGKGRDPARKEGKTGKNEKSDSPKGRERENRTVSLGWGGANPGGEEEKTLGATPRRQEKSGKM